MEKGRNEGGDMKNELTEKNIEKRIYTIRNIQVMFDSDLAEMYGVTVSRLNEQVKRNPERFPEDFMFQLTQAELDSLRSQNAILKTKDLKSQNVASKNNRGQHRKYLPFVFTEQGVAGLSGVLKSETAAKVHVAIMRTFVKLRHFAISQTDTNAQITELRKLLMLHIENTDYKFSEHEKAIRQILQALDNLIEHPKPAKKIGFGT